ncbi:MAG: tetratricopeptide repeat protein [Deltaproteobacteria bacterium]|nr:tetratricopeptide repeat protein [Deltaproteobacteria bacterium]
MAAQHVGRALGWTIGCLVAPALLGTMFGKRWIAVGVAIAILATMWLVLWLPRSAHAAFRRARYARASRRYRLLAALAFSAARERAALLSRAGADVAAGKLARAEAALAAIDGVALESSERAVWLNNRACAALDAGRDATAALALVDEAIGLRPDVPAIQHTRARALLAVGRLDDAIAVLDAMRAGGELEPQLEAQRCSELAAAWERKGQADYASDYRDRARLLAAS